MRHRCDVATTYANHPSSMMYDIDRIDLFDDNCGILSLAEQTAVDALCGWAIALLCIDVFCGRTKHTQNKTIYTFNAESERVGGVACCAYLLCLLALKQAQ